MINYRAWNCDTCVADLMAFNAYMRSNQAAQSIVEILQGPLFCEDPALSLSEEQKSTCKVQGPNGIIHAFGIDGFI